MKMSASIELVWQLAGQEAIAAEFKEIEAEHFFAALLKFSEMEVDQVERIASGSEAVKELIAEVNAVHQELQSRSIDSTRVRRELRARLGKGNSPYDGGQMHRSEGSRSMFDAAAKLADDARGDVMTACHLLLAALSSPTPLMKDVLGQAKGPAPPKKPSGTRPLLAELGQDLVHLAETGQLPMEEIRKREMPCTALLDVLARPDRRSAFVVADSDDEVGMIVAGVAAVMAGRNAPPGLKGRRIVNISGVDPLGAVPAEGLEQFERMFAEAASAKDIILYIPPLDAKPSDRTINAYGQLLQGLLARRTVQCVGQLTLAADDKWVRNNPAWKPLVRVVRVHKPEHQIPDEL